ncbi:MAG: restriction endonuclease subunit S, partial [Pseudanabaena sp.]
YVEENKKFTLNQRICSIRAKNIDSRYLFYFLNRNKYFLSFDSGVGQTNLRKDDILKCPVLVPSIFEQQKIAKTLSLMDQEISLLEKQLHSLKTQKQGLMQQLLTGKIRVQTP